MTYKFADRAKEWTTYAGVVSIGLAALIPNLLPANDSHWIELWQALQYILGAALAFIPQTAGTQAVEREAFTLLKAFAAELPPEYQTALRPTLSLLSQAVMQASTSAPPVTAPDPSNTVLATPVANPASSPLPEPTPGATQ